MPETEIKPAPAPVLAPTKHPAEIIFASATEALGGAFMVWILGGVAISIAGAFAGNMVPSAPPFWHGGEPSSAHGTLAANWWSGARGVAFGAFFAIFFAHSLWVGFRAGAASTPPMRRLERIFAKLREDWFGIIIKNAIGAWCGSFIVGLVSEFSIWHIVQQWIWSAIQPTVHSVGVSIFGSSAEKGAGDWFSWYGANQIKLTFWLLYLAGIFDDLGVPNYKTLARWAWRRAQKRRTLAGAPLEVPGGSSMP